MRSKPKRSLAGLLTTLLVITQMASFVFPVSAAGSLVNIAKNPAPTDTWRTSFSGDGFQVTGTNLAYQSPGDCLTGPGIYQDDGSSPSGTMYIEPTVANKVFDMDEFHFDTVGPGISVAGILTGFDSSGNQVGSPVPFNTVTAGQCEYSVPITQLTQVRKVKVDFTVDHDMSYMFSLTGFSYSNLRDPLSNNADLNDLKVDGTSVSGFSSGNTGPYTVNVPNTTVSVTVEGTANDPNASVNVSGGSNLIVGDNTVSVTVTAEDGITKKDYLVTVHRISNDADLSDLKVNGTSVNGFDPSNTGPYTVNVPNSTTSVTVTGTASHSKATVVVSGGNNLVVGDNPVTVTVTAEDGTTIKNYSINVNRAKSSNASLSNLTVSEGDLTPFFSSGRTSYTANVGHRVSSITVTPTTADSTATLTVNGDPATSGTASSSIRLDEGPNTITIMVTAQDGTNQTYSVTVTRAANTVPEAVDDGPYPMNQDTTLTVNATNGVLTNDTDTDGDPLTAVLETAPTHGMLTMNPDGSFTYTPARGSNGSDSFTYKANDGYSDSNTATVTLVVNDNVAPEAPEIVLSPSTWTNGKVTATVNEEPGAAVEYRIGDSGSWLPYSGPIDLDTEGEYAFEARQTDTANNVSDIAREMVRIDRTAPVISLNGSIDMSVYQNDTFVDPGANVTDNLSTNLNASVSGNVDTAKIGTYTLHYQVSDLAGNAAQEITRTVNVIAKPLGLSFNAADYRLKVDQTIPFTVTMRYSDDREIDVTNDSVLTFDPSGIASSPAAGQLHGDHEGTTILTAVYDGKSVSANVHVRIPNGDPSLNGITLSAGTLTPIFSPEQTSYSVRESNSVSSLAITANATSAQATVSIDGAASTLGSQSAPIGLHTGSNKIDIVVTAENGTTRTYHLDIWRENPTDNPGGGTNNGGTNNGGTNNESTSNNSTNNSGPKAPSFPILVNGAKQEEIGTATKAKAPNGQSRLTITLDQEKLNTLLDKGGNHTVVTIPIGGSYGQIIGVVNGQIVSKMRLLDATLKIQAGSVTYTLPVQQLNLNDAMRRLGIDDLNKMNLEINLSQLTDEQEKLVENQANNAHLKTLVPPVTFTITATNGNRSTELTRFGAYLQRTFEIPEGMSRDQITTGVIWKADGTFQHVPTKILKQDGKYLAEISSLTNSTYTVVYHTASFEDVAQHWSKDTVNEMASRLIVNGKDEAQFDPNGMVTRAEFAAMLDRAIGLGEYQKAPSFKDVTDSAWYHDAVAIAKENGLISGFEDNTFRPNGQITREEAMVMIAQAMKLAGKSPNLTSNQVESTLSRFQDGTDVSTWAKEAAAACIQSTVVVGSNNQLHSKDQLTRAEAATMLMAMLKALSLI
ncbi:cadherin-like beta sandwich domain-containing protein [Paenibacillus sp. Y412MC10]|uniref:cadherin-like beta sandwich domain-containing protein n=1 Tax=Geobacillus sp. (strain Y412MC10) TaxID=481743 RepID=UPI0011AB58D9|nr:cadherin-like beta sandwich domain-containing protein [Paenibacillus sp. Y412MC10]